jgi:glycosyltransferase involved in cell wall biosynthesis
MKGHEIFVRAAELLCSWHPSATFVCVGEGKEPYRSEVLKSMQSPTLGDRFRWLGVARDMPAFYSALTVATCSSRFGEGFSNAIGEAMACGVPCVVTDVGDLPMVVGDTGIVVPPDDPAALAAAWGRMLGEAGPQRSAACRSRIVEHFGVPAMVSATEKALCRLLGR